MDPLTISPSWVEHCTKLLPGFGFVSFSQTDNEAPEQDEFVIVTQENLKKLIRLPYGVFASLMAFDQDLQRFYDSFLTLRERMGLNRTLFEMDILIFSLFYRLVADIPPNIKLSAGAKANSIVGLNIITPGRLLSIVSLYHRPGSPDHSPLVDMVERWILLNPSFEREVSRMLESWSLSRVTWNERNAAGLRGFLEILPFRASLFARLGGVRSTFEQSLQVFVDWYTQSKSNSERSNILACLHISLSSLDANSVEKLFDFVSSDSVRTEDRIMLGDLSKQIVFIQTMTHHCISTLKIDSLRLDYFLSMIDNFPTSEIVTKIEFDEDNIFSMDIEMGSKHESAEQLEQETAFVDNDLSDVDRLKEIAPHLGKYFCERLLEACNWSLERAIACVMDGSIPEHLLHIDFAAEHPPQTIQQPLQTGPSSNSEYGEIVNQEEVSADTVIAEGIDEDLRAKIRAIYNRYEDEYDDTLDGGGRFAADTGAKNLEEDDPEEEEYSDVDDEGVSEKKLVPTFVPRSVDTTKVMQKQPGTSQKRGFAETSGDMKQRSQQQKDNKNTDRKQSLSQRQPEREPMKGSKEMTAPVSREQSFIDANGERRNARGELVEEDVLMRPNLNRSIAPPLETTRQKVSNRQKRELTPEEEAARLKRERERKDIRGNRVRQRGADKKQAKSGV